MYNVFFATFTIKQNSYYKQIQLQWIVCCCEYISGNVGNNIVLCIIDKNTNLKKCGKQTQILSVPGNKPGAQNIFESPLSILFKYFQLWKKYSKLTLI